MHVTLHFSEKLKVEALASVLLAVHQFDVRVAALQIFLSPVAGEPTPRITRLSLLVRRHEQIIRRLRGEAVIIKGEFHSPGLVTVDASGALVKVIDILHSGDLAKEEKRAIIERIQAETDLIRAQAAKHRTEALRGAVAVLQSLQLSPSEIIRLLKEDPALISLIGLPTAQLEAAHNTKVLQDVVAKKGDTDTEL